MASQIWLYDTTLRDGAQREGIALSLEDKLRVARQLAQLGLPFIEAGWPGANPKDGQLFQQLQEVPLNLSHAVAFCSTRRPGKRAEEDRMLQAILAAETHWVTIFGKSWDLHVTEGLKTSLDKNLAMIHDTLTFLRGQGREVIYDAEHWFDGFKANPSYALETLKSAKNAGAKWLVLCDTNGGTLPHDVSQIVKEVVKVLNIEPNTPDTIQLGIHAHNDSGTAVANSLAAVTEGARMVQGTINGYGERCGNANLCTLIPNLQIKMGYQCLSDEQLAQLSETSRLISEIANLAPDEHAPFVGRSAFAHKGGIHVSAVQKNPITYEHIEPELIGNERRIVISEQSGLSNITSKAKAFGIELDPRDKVSKDLLEHLKNLEHQGYQFEAAEASFELLMREALGQRRMMFRVKGFQVHCDLLEGDNLPYSSSLATIKITVGGEDILEVAEGNGPISALDLALRKALVKFYPEIADFHLSDYKVRILNGEAGTGATTRVLIESSNGKDRWTTVGVSSNILDASYQAVVEAIEYGLLLVKAPPPVFTRRNQIKLVPR